MAVSDEHGQLTHATMFEGTPETSLQEQLSHFVEKHGFEQYPCIAVLSSHQYQLLLVERPPVEDAELRDAIKWKVKDLIAHDLSDTVMDAFALPVDGVKTGKPMSFVVAADKNKIAQLVDTIQEADLNLKRIEIEEMALRNLGLLKVSSATQAGIAIVRIYEGGGTVNLFREGNLYLSRQFKLHYQAGLLDDIPAEALSLEIQRSLDYYERHMGLAPPIAVYLCGENVSADKVTEGIERGTTVPVKFLDLSERFQVPDECDDSMMQLCIGAIGGLCRTGEVV